MIFLVVHRLHLQQLCLEDLDFLLVLQKFLCPVSILIEELVHYRLVLYLLRSRRELQRRGGLVDESGGQRRTTDNRGLRITAQRGFQDLRQLAAPVGHKALSIRARDLIDDQPERHQTFVDAPCFLLPRSHSAR